MEPIESPPITASGPGVRRTVVTAALALGLLVAGGTAVAFAASPDPSISATPGTTTQPSTDDPATTAEPGTTGAATPDCPEGAGGRGPGRGTAPADDGASEDGTSSPTTPSTPSTAPESTPDTTTPTPTTTPQVDDSEV